MRIAQVRCFSQWQPFVHGPYVMSMGRVEHGFDAVVVELTAEDGTVGWGEGAPIGSTYDPAFGAGVRAAAPLLAEALVGSDAAPGAVARTLVGALKGHPYARSAFDMAAWDLLGRRAGVPLVDLVGGHGGGDGTPLYRSIGRDDPLRMADRAVELLADGYQRLQVKVGGDPALDALALRSVADVAVHATLYCDANGGWTTAQAREFLRRTTAVSYVLEQPCATLRECIALRAQTDRPLVVDESIESVADVIAAAQGGVDGITIKIARVGGVTPAVRCRDVAVDLGLQVTIEDTGGADLDTAAMAHLSLSTPEHLRTHTCDFHRWVTVSNGRGLPPVDDGVLRVPDGPGLGIEVDVSALGTAFVDASSAG